MLRWWSTSWQVRVSALLAVTALAGFTAVSAAPDDGKVIGIWPVGAAVGALLLAPRRWVPAMLAAVVVLALLTVGLGGRPWAVAAGYAVTIGVEVALVWWLLARGRERTWVLQRDADLRRWFVACVIGVPLLATATALLLWPGDRQITPMHLVLFQPRRQNAS